MNNISLKVTANRIEILSDTYTTEGSVNFDSCTFQFDSTWTGFQKTAVFGFGDFDYVRVSLENDTCKIPAVCLQKEGIIQIGVYGINDDEIVITTNSVAHRVNESISETGTWVEEDSYFVYNAVKELEGALDKYKASLDERFNYLLRLVRENGGLIDISVQAGEPDEWYLPRAFTDAANVPSSRKSSEYEEYFEYILNGLVEDFPDYASVCEIGIDSSSTYPIYAYTFEPLNYEKTVLVTSGLTSPYSDSIISISHFLDELCRNCESSRTLSYIRSKVKLVVLPAVNPYALVKGKSYNSNDIELNRNFPYKWNECVNPRKGSAPADQAETAAIIDFVNGISSDKLCAVLNLKLRDSAYSGKLAFYPRFKANCVSAINNTLSKFNFEEDNAGDILQKTVLAPSMTPSLINYLADEYGINACSVSWPSINYGLGESNESITKFCELIGNMLYTMAKNSSFTLKGSVAPFTKYFSWRSNGNSDVFSISSTNSLQKVPISSYELYLKSPCNITLTGYATVKVTSVCTVKINPVLWQEHSPEQTYDERVSMDDFSVEVPLTVGTHVLPLNSVLQGYYSDDNVFGDLYHPKKLMFTLAVKASAASSAKLTGFSVTLNAFESDLAKPVEITTPMGSAADYTDSDDVPTQEIVYPLEAVTSYDVDYYD